MGWLWKHCVNGHELGHPTLTDEIIGYVVCPDCRSHEPVDDDQRREAIDEILKRLVALENYKD